MTAVIFDLELVKRFRKGQLSEIVEIGACKVDLQSRTITDTFQVYILPQSGVFTHSTRKFIHMTNDDAASAVSFQEGIHRFKAWLGKAYYLSSWGKDDKIHLIDQCRRHQMDLDWFKNYTDIQKPIGKLMNNPSNKQLGLKNALKAIGIEPTGKLHRGVDDAINTAYLLIHFIDQIELQTNVLTAEDLVRRKKTRRSPRTNRSPNQTTSAKVLPHPVDNNKQEK